MHLQHLLLMMIAGSPLLANSAKAGEPSAADLIRLASDIKSSDEKLKSIELSGYWNDDNGNTMLRFRSIYKAPDRYALVLSDANETPLSFVSDHKLLVYNPVRPEILYSDKDASCQTWIRMENEALKWSLDSPVSENKLSTVQFDIKSMLQRESLDDELHKFDLTKYRLTRTSASGNFFVFYIDTSLNNPYYKFELVLKHTNKVRLCVERITIDGVLEERDFAFPIKSQLVEKIAVRDLSVEGLVATIGSLVSMSRAYQARMTASQPEFDNLITLYGIWKINWESVKKNDEKYSQMLKTLVPCKPRWP